MEELSIECFLKHVKDYDPIKKSYLCIYCDRRFGVNSPNDKTKLSRHFGVCKAFKNQLRKLEGKQQIPKNLEDLMQQKELAGTSQLDSILKHLPKESVASAIQKASHKSSTVSTASSSPLDSDTISSGLETIHLNDSGKNYFVMPDLRLTCACKSVIVPRGPGAN